MKKQKLSRNQSFSYSVMGSLTPAFQKVLANYRSRSISPAEKIMYVLGGFVSCGLFLISWRVYSYAYHHYGPSAADSWSYSWTLLGWVVGLAWMIGIIIRIFLNRWAVGVYDQGVMIQRPLRQAQIFPWQQFLGISTQIHENTLFKYSWGKQQRVWLCLRTGETILLDAQIIGLPELTTRLKANLYPRLLPDLRVALRDKHWVTFGPLSIHRLDGLKMKIRGRDLIYAWKQIQQIDIEEGCLVIESPGCSRRFHTGEIPNLELLLQLIREEIP